jgi:hypothetical protein
LIAICVVGIVLNCFAFSGMASKEPEGAMGMGIILPFLLVPYLVAAGYYGSKLFGK